MEFHNICNEMVAPFFCATLYVLFTSLAARTSDVCYNETELIVVYTGRSCVT